MKTKLTVATALAGTLLATCLVSGSAQATSVPVLKSDANPGIVTLVGKKGGGGGGHARGGGGGGGKHARGGGGGRHYGGGGGGKRYAHGGGGGGKRYYGGGGGGKRYYGGDGGGKRYHGGDGGKRYANKDHNNRHYAMKDRDHHDHGNIHNRHRVFRNGAWVWVYGTGYTAYGGDCYWLHRQAIITGSPYWWDRYNACVGYDYY